jgi:gliding motility-associated-like protein
MNAGNDVVICRHQQTSLRGSGAVKFNWVPGATLSCTDCASPIARPDSTTRYFVQGENIFGCTSRDSVLITVKQPFKIAPGTGDTLCKGETYMLKVSGAELYNWSPVTGLDNPASSSPKARPDTTTLYRVVGRDDHDCFTDTGYIRIVVYPFPLVEAGKNETISAGASINLAPVLSNDVKTIRWSPDKWLSCYNCPNPIATPKQTTRYTIEVANQGGCITRDEITLFVICESGNLFVPNTFSPNGDGINDVFYPRGKGIYGIRNFRVFDRWGELVFEKTNFQPNDASKGWNGSLRGKLASQDVYIYTIDVICENNVVFSYKGNVTLIR